MGTPRLRVPNRSRQMIDTFGGYNHNLRIGDGEFYEMKNMTSDHYPVLSPREKRGIYTSAEHCTGMIAKDSLCYCNGSKFVINGHAVEMGLSDAPKQLISMGAYVIILPDKKYINTNSEAEDFPNWGSMENEVTTQANAVFTLCKQDGTPYTPQHTGPDEPKSPANMDNVIFSLPIRILFKFFLG